MNIIKKYSIQTKSDIIFVKVDMKNYLKRENYDYTDFLIFVLMELATNLIKYADGGYIWLLENDKKLALSCFDNGIGIENLSLAKEKGFTTADNSLGLGLHQIANNPNFNMQIYTRTKEENSGTIVLVSQKDLDEESGLFLTKPYMDLEQNGDFFQRKGKYYIFGDSSGHGIKAQKSAKYIKRYFKDNFVSFSLAKDFLQELHTNIKDKHLRSAVLSIVEKNSNKIAITGVGNLDIWIETSVGFDRKTFAKGIVGEFFGNLHTHEFELHKKQKLIISTDGLESRETLEFLNTIRGNHSSLMFGLMMVHFLSSKLDDNSILIFEER